MVPPAQALKPKSPRHTQANWVKHHPLEEECHRALNIAKRVGRRLQYQLRDLERKERELEKPVGYLGLPSSDWNQQMKTYVDTIRGLLHENRKYIELQIVAGSSMVLDVGEESEELMGAVSLLSDEELAIALARRSELKAIEVGGDQ